MVKANPKEGNLSNLKKFVERALDTPIFPFLIVLWLILARYNRNVDELALKYAAEVLIVCLLVVGIASLFLAWRHKSRKSYLFLGWITFLFFIYGDIHSAFVFVANQYKILSIAASYAFTLGFMAVCSYLVISQLSKSEVNVSKIYKTVNTILLLLLIFNLFAPIKRALENKNPVYVSPEFLQQEAKASAGSNRDIYYLVFDRYASNETLKKLYGYDNSAFLGYLKDKGFFINDNAHSNYQYTTQSVSSTLNLRYFDEESRLYRDTDRNLQPYYDLLNRNAVGKFVTKLGYKYYHIGSWWQPTRESDEATKNYSRASYITFLNYKIYPNEFTHLVLQNSLLRPVLDHRVKIGEFSIIELVIDIKKVHANTFEYQLDSIKEVINTDDRKYTFGHFLLPHPPFVFRENGQVYFDEKTSEVDKKAYIEQLKYTNSEIKKMIDSIMAKPGEKPVIILQADEGPYPKDYYKNRKEFNWQTASADSYQEKFGVLSAYYLPDNPKQQPYAGISGVNTFRLVFNNYFKTDFPLLNDRSYIFEREKRYYNFIDITGSWDASN